MSICGFDLAPWSPEAFATLLTGLAAVGAAVYVGRKQTAIGQRQTAILERQAEIQIGLAHLEKMKIRVSLFDKRFEVYEATQRMLVQIVKSAAPPDGETQRAFTLALDRSRLLFGDDVYDRMRGIWGDVCDLEAAIAMMEGLRGAGDPKRSDYIQQKTGLLMRFVELSGNLSTVFGDKLILNERVRIE